MNFYCREKRLDWQVLEMNQHTLDGKVDGGNTGVLGLNS